MTYVYNSFGAPLDWDAIGVLMDDDIREQVHMQIAPCTEQEFFTAYCAAHQAKFGETFALDCENPQY